MGEFLALSAVAGASMDHVEKALRKFFQAEDIGLLPANELDADPSELLILATGEENKVSVQFPDDVMDFETPTAVLSQEIEAPVFGFHIHDGDFWMYLLYAGGEEVDRFCPVPDYFVEETSDEEIEAFSGNVEAVCRHWPGAERSVIEPYLVTWEDVQGEKAHPDDFYGYGADHQLEDFMGRLGLPFPCNNDVGVQRRFFRLD